jgi:hypothetical protein
MNEIASNLKIVDTNLKLSDVDVEFIATNSGTNNEGLNPDRALVRY